MVYVITRSIRPPSVGPMHSACCYTTSPCYTILNLPITIVDHVISAKKVRVLLCQSLNHHNHLLLNLFFHPALLLPTPTEALTGSMVKIASHNILAIWKLLVSLAFIPALYTTYILITLFIMLCSDWPRSIKLLTPLLAWNLLLFISYASMRFGENGINVYCSLHLLFLSIIDPASVENLCMVHGRLSHDITDLINKYGTK
ncbi:hypothetical protein BC938DRAFT_477865, partial [Jimgerdemannia flammicorona]